MSRDRLLSIKQLADRWGWSVSKIYRLVVARRIPHVRLRGGGYYFREAEIEAWLEAQTLRPREAPAVSPDRAAECAALGIPVEHEFT